MKTRTAIGLILIFILLFSYPLMNAAADWTDDFESYTPGLFPSDHWTVTGSNDMTVNNSNSCEGSQSLRFHGAPGGCWESIPCTPLEVDTSGKFSIEFCVYVSSDHVEGCHPWTGGTGLMTQCSWTSGQGVPVVDFWYDMSIWSRIDNSLGTYAYNTWYKVRMTYERVDVSTVRVAYWIDDVFKGTQDVPAESYEDDLLYFHGSSGDGTVWLDDLRVTSCMDTEEGLCSNGIDDDCDGLTDADDPNCDGNGGNGNGGDGDGGCGCAMFSTTRSNSFVQVVITGLIYLLPFCYIVIFRRRFKV